MLIWMYGILHAMSSISFYSDLPWTGQFNHLNGETNIDSGNIYFHHVNEIINGQIIYNSRIHNSAIYLAPRRVSHTHSRTLEFSCSHGWQSCKWTSPGNRPQLVISNPSSRRVPVFDRLEKVFFCSNDRLYRRSEVFLLKWPVSSLFSDVYRAVIIYN
jgi:hypothetical protein